MKATELLRAGWQQAVREWVYRVRPELADEFVQFFDLAFKPIAYREQALFGVHSSRISLCVGNIWLAAFSKRIWLLVDEPLRDPRFDFELAKSTKRYIPLHWLIATPEAVTEILQSENIWTSYANACLKVLESPISRTNILKNQINKVRLSELETGLAGQLPEESTLSLQDTQTEFPEGGIQEVTLELRKRSPLLRKQAIARYGYRCQICGFSFEEFYGDLGKGYIEVHHLTPLSDREDEASTRLEDVAVVCANCHRILHRNGKNPIPIETLREMVKHKRKAAG
jgi:hypothetical protein